MKKLMAVVLAGLLLFSLTACGNSGEAAPAQASPAAADPLTAAQEGFQSAAQSLSDAQSSLSGCIAEAEALLERVTEEDVEDPQTISELKDLLEKAKAAQGYTAPEMGPGIEKIQEQTQSIQEQADNTNALYYDLDSAISQTESSEQSLRDRVLRESVTAKLACTGTTATVNGYEAEYKVSVTGWIKASDAESLQLAWEGVAKEGEIMPALSQFHSTANDGFTEANAAVAFGQISFRNITQGFDITEESPVTFGLMLSTSFGKFNAHTPKIYLNFSNGPKTYNFNDYPSMSPLMKSNSWGPIAFMLVCPNVITPNDPDGAVLDDFELIINGDRDNAVCISPSW